MLFEPNKVTSPPIAVNPVPPFATGTVPDSAVACKFVQFARLPADGVPRDGVVNDGEVAKTSAPVPVSSVTAAAAFALDGVAKNVAMPVPNPETPVLIGKPVALVNTAADGVPSAGVTNVGDVARTGEPDPVAAVQAGKADAPPPTSMSVVAPAARV